METNIIHEFKTHVACSPKLIQKQDNRPLLQFCCHFASGCTPDLPLNYSEPQCLLFYKGNLKDNLGINYFKRDKAIDLYVTSNSLFIEQDKIC